MIYERGIKMFNASEFRFLREAFGKCRIPVSLHNPDEPISVIANEQFRSIMTIPQTSNTTLAEFIGEHPRASGNFDQQFFNNFCMSPCQQTVQIAETAVKAVVCFDPW